MIYSATNHNLDRLLFCIHGNSNTSSTDRNLPAHTHTQVEWPKPDKDNMVHMDWLVTLATRILASFPDLLPGLGMRHHVVC